MRVMKKGGFKKRGSIIQRKAEIGHAWAVSFNKRKIERENERNVRRECTLRKRQREKKRWR